MIDAFYNAVFGLAAASRTLAGHAHNLAHTGATGRLSDDPFRLVETTNVSRAGGRVTAIQRDRDPSSVESFQPDKPYASGDGLVALANVDPGVELVGMIQARAQFQANLRTLSVADELTGFLVDSRA